MRILLTNDDGINADGIYKLAEIVTKITDEVYIVAPNQERSGVSHGITVRESLKIKKQDFPFGVKAYSCSGTPADCVKAAVHAIMPAKPDFVISGINHGYNVGFDTVYSGTVAAARDAAYQGIKSAAVSAFSRDFRIADLYLKDIIEDIVEKDLQYHEIWNINFPSCEPNVCKGIKTSYPSMKSFYMDSYEKKAIGAEEWEIRLIDDFTKEHDHTSDVHAVNNGYVSVGKIVCDTLRINEKNKGL